MSTTTIDLTLRIQAREVFTTVEAPSAPDEAGRTLTAGAFSLSKKLNATSVPKADKPPVSLTITIGGGITTINLAAVAGLAMPPGTRTLDMTGAKVGTVLLRAKTTNVAAVNVAPGAANPYPLFGAGNDIDVHPGRVIAAGYDAVATAQPGVAAGVKNIDISGTLGDVLYLDLSLGT